jgi:ribonuclease HII
MQRKRKLPQNDLYEMERELHLNGLTHVAGIDEAGRGPLAGPVVAAAVILPSDLIIPGINDSKKLSAKKREFLFDEIRARALSVGVGIIDSVEIDEINILQATLKAMRSAVLELSTQPGFLLIDGIQTIDSDIPQRAVKKGDSLSAAIAAASIIAKVTRDRMMCEAGLEYPSFKFSVHKGYGTAAHLEEIRSYGPTPIHRKTFRGVK